MSPLTRSQVLDHLARDWGGYVAAYGRMAPDELEAWLARQGFARFADVLAHVIAWWDEGYAAVAAIAAGQAIAPKEYDVDAFNAQAIARCAALNEEPVIALFEEQRRRWVTLISQLPDSALADTRITDRLQMELTGHWQGHALPQP